MHRGGQRSRSHRFAAAVVLALGFAAVDASAVDDDPLADTSESLQTLKPLPDEARSATRTPLAGSILPATPTEQTTASTAPSWLGDQTDEKEHRAEQDRAANWLLEAMLRGETSPTSEQARSGHDADRSLSSEDRQRLETQARLLGVDPDLLFSETSAGADSTADPAGKPPPPKTTAPPPNPLDDFLSSWLSPSDFALMRRAGAIQSDSASGSDGSPSDGRATSRAGADTLAGPGASWPLPLNNLSSSTSGSLGWNDAASDGYSRDPRAVLAARENPFLAGLVAPPVFSDREPPGIVAPATPFTVPAAPAAPFAPPPTTPAPTVESPDGFPASPREDDRYFPQARRF